MGMLCRWIGSIVNAKHIIFDSVGRDPSMAGPSERLSITGLFRGALKQCKKCPQPDCFSSYITGADSVNRPGFDEGMIALGFDYDDDVILKAKPQRSVCGLDSAS